MRRHGVRGGCLVALAAGLFGSLAPRGSTEEVVRLRPGGLVVRGEIVQYDESGISLKLANGRTVFYESARIAEVEANYAPAHVAANQALERRQFAKAVAEFEKAIAEEKREWARHRIRSGMVTALWRSGQAPRAVQEFLKLLEERSDTEVMVLAPLFWRDDQPIDIQLQETAKRWLDDSRPAAVLIACSWLLTTSDRNKVLPILERLGTNDERRVSWLAKAQYWRTKVAGAGDAEIARYRELLDKMPSTIRGGPQFVLGQMLERRGNQVEAALAYLWIPLVFEASSELALEASFRAANCCDRAGLYDDARRLYRELVEKYPGTPWATQASHRLAARVPAQERRKEPAPPRSG